jgi:long-chain acyl-CoA synthetase
MRRNASPPRRSPLIVVPRSTEFAETLAARLAAYGPRPCIEFERRWYSGDEITGYHAAIERELARLGIGTREPVALVVRNRVPHAAAVLGFIAGGRPVSMVYSYQSAQAIAGDIQTIGPAAVLSDPQDWSAELSGAARSTGAAGVLLGDGGPTVEVAHSRAAVLADDGLDILSSGTTGAPKRVHLPTKVLAHTVASMTLGADPGPPDVEAPPALVFWPFGSVGVCQLLAGAYSGQRIVLLEKFTVEDWVRAVSEYQIQFTGAQPTILRMLLAAEVPRADLASLQCLAGGGGPLEPELQAAFEDRYGIPLLWGYGATEFAGTVCAWTPALRDELGGTKPGTVGRPLPGVEVRIEENGLLSARVEVLGPQWITTTDIASIDDDGIVTVHGRADGAINRGGFKILPERVRAALLTHPAVHDACVVGVPDARVGQLPFAAVELKVGHTANADDLKDTVRAVLPAQSVPVAIAILDELPRNAAMKVRLDAVRALYPNTLRKNEI